MSAHEMNLLELSEGLTKTLKEVTQKFMNMYSMMDKRMEGFGVKMNKMDNNFAELKQLISSLLLNKSGEASNEVEIGGDSTGMGSTNISELNRSTSSLHFSLNHKLFCIPFQTHHLHHYLL